MAVLMALAAGVAACSSGGEGERGLEGLTTPTFAPDDGDAGPASTAPSTTIDATAPTSTAAPAVTNPGAPAATAVPDPNAPAGPDREVVSFDDPVGDAVGGLDDDPPPWSDLAGATLTRTGDAFGLSIRLGGGTPPERSDGRSTLNVATFFDVDGDGAVDYEIWANLGSEGWGAAWYDNVDGGGGFGEDSNVTIVVGDDSVDLIFPDVLLAGAERFRFSLASEYGEVDVLGSSFARRDDAPDGDQAVSFPS